MAVAAMSEEEQSLPAPGGLSYREISDRLGMPVRQVQELEKRALRKMLRMAKEIGLTLDDGSTPQGATWLK
jgi:DNA-directed RNA polymerase specialized sigma24 family protein